MQMGEKKSRRHIPCAVEAQDRIGFEMVDQVDFESLGSATERKDERRA
jgi:hypothetical protein